MEKKKNLEDLSVVQGYICCSVKSKYTTPLTIACQAPLFIEFSRPEYWSGSPFPSAGDLTGPGNPEDLPDQRREPGSPALEFFTTRGNMSPVAVTDAITS